MAAGQGLNIHGTAQSVLDAVVAHYAPVTGDLVLPDRRVVAPGNIRMLAWDCEAVLVAVTRVGWGVGPGTGSATAWPTGLAISSGGMRHVTIAVQIVRAVSDTDETPADAADVTTEGLLLARDAGMLSQALIEVTTTGALKRAGVGLAGEVDAVGPQGGFAAVESSVTVTAGELV
jgi:hypothetical protein